MKFGRRVWMPAALLVLVAMVQRGVVETRGMTPWKGGGMGMYSEFTYRDHEVWLRLDGPQREAEYEYLSEEELRSLLASSERCIRFQHEDCLNALADAIDKLESGVARPYTLSLWRFARTPEGFTRLPLAEVSRP